MRARSFCEQILANVEVVLQPCEEIGGPEVDEYIALMIDVARLALERAQRARENAQ